MAEKPTPEQEAAITDRGGRLLVSAAAGSGKTKVLVDRLMGYIDPQNDKMPPANINDFLIITYTKAAASELRQKIADKLSSLIAENPDNVHLQKQVPLLYLTQISTVHGFCSTILREYANMAGLTPDFRVADEIECAELRSLVLTPLLDRAYSSEISIPFFHEFINHLGAGRNDSAVPQLILQVYDSSRCHKDPDGWLTKCLMESEAENITDVSQLPWGKMLMEDFFRFLDEHIRVLTGLTSQMDPATMAKPLTVICSEIEQMKRLRASRSWDEIGKIRLDFPTLSFGRKGIDQELVEKIKVSRNASKEALKKRILLFTSPTAVIAEDLKQCRDSSAGLIELVRAFGKEYTRLKQSRHILDFGDLEHLTLDLLCGKNRCSITQAAREIGKRFREVMIDEYQDSNAVQDAVFNAITDARRNTFMVGDVKQSIYQFRLADPTIFLEKYHTYKPRQEAADGEGRLVLLTKNFRSGEEILDGVNDVFTACMSQEVGGLEYGKQECLYAGRVDLEPLPDPAVELHVLETPNESGIREAAFTADRIREMLDRKVLIRGSDGMRPVTPDDIVILLRSPNSNGDDYQNALEARGIRCFRNNGTDLLNTQEVTIFRGLLQVIINPRQDIPLLSVLASPLFGFTADDLAGIRTAASGDFYEALCCSDTPKAEQFCRILNELRDAASYRPLTILMEQCIRLTGMDGIFGAMPGGKARLENLQNFYGLACDYEQTALRGLDQFLQHLDNLQKSGKTASVSSSAGCVTIMSIHKSKGLEFPVVFLCSLSRAFNMDSCHEQVLCHKDFGLGLPVVDNAARFRYPSAAKQSISALMTAECISEELRVLYVAMTRARDRLIMTLSMKNAASRLANLANRVSAGGTKLLCQEASCPGDWILIAAISHTEAGELHNLGARPDNTYLPKFPWKIAYHDLSTELRDDGQEESPAEMPAELSHDTACTAPAVQTDWLKTELEYQYPHPAATGAPSKQTATGRKSSAAKESEAAEYTVSSPAYRASERRQPAFREARSIGGTAYGNAVHRAMQFIDYSKCTDVSGIARELERMQDHELLMPEQAEKIRPEMIVRFFETGIGQKLCRGAECVREFKFSLLDDGSQYGPELGGEHVLLQGVVDCALIESDGISIVDFKTDRIPEEGASVLIERYRPQLEVYTDAMRRIFEMPVKASYLYFFRSGELVKV